MMNHGKRTNTSNHGERIVMKMSKNYIGEFITDALIKIDTLVEDICKQCRPRLDQSSSAQV